MLKTVYCQIRISLNKLNFYFFKFQKCFIFFILHTPHFKDFFYYDSLVAVLILVNNVHLFELILMTFSLYNNFHIPYLYHHLRFCIIPSNKKMCKI